MEKSTKSELLVAALENGTGRVLPQGVQQITLNSFFSVLAEHFFKFGFELGFEFCRFKQSDLAFLGQNERKQQLFGNLRDLYCAVSVNDLMGVQRGGFQPVEGVTFCTELHVFYFFKAEKIIRVDGGDDLFIRLKTALAEFGGFDALQSKGAGLIFQSAERLGVPRIVVKDQSVRLDRPMG